jgi:hypothetical protein
MKPKNNTLTPSLEMLIISIGLARKGSNKEFVFYVIADCGK